MERPPARPEGALIRLARNAAGLTVPDAARAAGISKARWSQLESGRETRNGEEREVNGKPSTIAHMARVVGLSPERLETEGRRPDAADVLREILRTAPGASPVPAEGILAAIAEPDQDAAEWVMFPGTDRLSEQLRAAWILPQPEEVRVKMVRVIRAIWALDTTPEDERLDLIRAALATSPGAPGSGTGARRRSETA